MVALLTSVRNSPCFGGLRRTKTCHRQLFARPSVFLRYFLHAAKSTNPFPLREVRGFPNLDSVRRSRIFAPQQLKPFIKEASRFCKPRNSTHKQQTRAIQLNPFAALGGYFSALRRCSLTGTFEVLQTSIQRTAAAVRLSMAATFCIDTAPEI